MAIEAVLDAYNIALCYHIPHFSEDEYHELLRDMAIAAIKADPGAA